MKLHTRRSLKASRLAGWSRRRCGLPFAAGLLAAALLLPGCDDDDIDHSPPAGQGSIVIENDGYEDVDVYIDGAYQARVKDGHWRAFDCPPGVYRVVLDEDDSDRTYRDDVDVLVGRLTVLDVRSSSGFHGDLPVDVSID